MEDFEVSQVMGSQFKYVDEFINNNFMYWKLKMETILKEKNICGTQ